MQCAGLLIYVACLQGLGLEYAKHLIARGACTLVLTSRNPQLPLETLKSLVSQGATVFTVRADAAKSDNVAAVIAWVQEHLPCVRHVVHAAGVSDFHLLPDMGDEDFWSVARTKVSWDNWHFSYMHNVYCASSCTPRDDLNQYMTSWSPGNQMIKH